MSKTILLNKNQENILKSFINNFLPPTKNKRKYSGNELDFIYSTLDRVFIQNFGFNLSRKNIIDIFTDLNYTFFTLNSTWNSDKKEHIPSKNGEIDFKISDNTIGKETPFTYININASTMRDLRKTTANLPSNTNLSKYAKIELLKQNIVQFAKEVKTI